MILDKVRQTHKIAHADKNRRELELVKLLFPGSGEEKSLGEQLFLHRVFYVCVASFSWGWQ